MTVCVAVYWSGTKLMTAAIPENKKKAGAKFGKKACIHVLCGNCKTITPARREAVRKAHITALKKAPDGAHKCGLDCGSRVWKSV